MPPDILEPEVLPPATDSGSTPRTGTGHRPTRGILLLAGLVIDAVDLLTFGPMGIRFGFFLGFAVSFLVLTLARVPGRQRITWSLLAGLYCAIPVTERLPLATLFGALVGR